jgi:hypothetical protein
MGGQRHDWIFAFVWIAGLLVWVVLAMISA